MTLSSSAGALPVVGASAGRAARGWWDSLDGHPAQPGPGGSLWARPAARFVDRRSDDLFAIAYRMLGSVMDAEDIVQEAYLQWQRRGDIEIASPKAFLSTIVTRQSINQLHAAWARRETYPGPWLPEPVIAGAQPDTADRLLLHESLSMAFMVLLEQLTPVERAVFLLHDVFAYDFHEIAGMVGKEEANCRQIARRARHHVQARRPRFHPDPLHHQRLTQQFIAACTRGDLESAR